MQDDKQKRIKALADIANGSMAKEEPREPYVSEDTEYFSKLRSAKDKRAEKIKNKAQTSFLEMLEDKDKIEEQSLEGLTDEQREQIAADTLARKRKEMGIYDK